MDWLWFPFIALAIWAAFKAGRQTERDEATERQRKSEQDDIDLGTIAPIAAMMVMGRLTPEEAEREVRRSALLFPSAQQLWKSMTQAEREKLGVDFIKLSADPQFQATQQKLVEGMKELDPELWEEAEKAVTKSLGPTPTGGQA